MQRPKPTPAAPPARGRPAPRPAAPVQQPAARSSFFAGIGAAPMPHSGIYPKDGQYLVQVEAIKVGTSSKGDGDYIAVELTVLDVLVEYEGSNRAGERISWVVMKKHGLTALSNLRGFFVALLDCAPEDLTDDTCEEACADDGEDLKGTHLEMTATTITTKRGTPFTKCTWSPESQAE